MNELELPSDEWSDEDVLGLMNELVEGLSDEEIEKLAEVTS